MVFVKGISLKLGKRDLAANEYLTFSTMTKERS